ncbi:MAG: YggS family pyridoxal phosphate-dependent enzyme [Cyclobacteriaceae bacterium]|nr:YggS family pyridoxal phosphate-dependent enzyme [Cyclobacteriaceae bacterium]
MGIQNNIAKFQALLNPYGARLIAVSKTHPVGKIQEAYEAGQRLFGENKVQEMVDKQPQLPGDIEWHLIGHLQRNKVKYIAPFVTLIHAVDSLRLLEEINKQGAKFTRIIPCLLQVYIATEETKFGLDPTEVRQLVTSPELAGMKNVRVDGLMGMASLTANTQQVQKEFHSLKALFEELKVSALPANAQMKELSMGMSSDYEIALKEGSTLVRIGTAIFGEREYSQANT